MLLRILRSGLLALVSAVLPLSVSAADMQLAPIPDMYVGTWWHHGMSFTITKFQGSPESGWAVAQWRTYTPCQDSTAKKTNPPPCDRSVANMIAGGGIASIALVHPQGQDDRNLSGVVTATSDPNGGFGTWGADVEFVMLPGNMLLVGPTMYCSDSTDFSLYPQYPCGA